jgi:hypothetical protein
MRFLVSMVKLRSVLSSSLVCVRINTLGYPVAYTSWFLHSSNIIVYAGVT